MISFAKRGIHSLTNFLLLPLTIDLLIALVSLFGFVLIIAIAILNRNDADLINLIFSLIAFLYSSSSYLTKLNNDRKQLGDLKIKTENIFKDCRNIILSHYPYVDGYTNKTEEKILETYLDEWKKHQNIKPFEYELIESYLNHFVVDYSFDESDNLFLKYRVITSDYNSYFPRLVSEIERGDFYTNDSMHNKFIKKVYLFSNNQDFTKIGIDFELDGEKVADTVSFALKIKNEFVESLLKEKDSKARIQFLLNKCYQNAYTNIGNIQAELKDDSTRNLIFMFKYDERFSILRRKWHTEIKNDLASKLANEAELVVAYKEAVEKLDRQIISPQPFSRAIREFSYCINQIGKDYFSFIIDPDEFDQDAIGWTPEKFIKDRVIPRAQWHLKDFNKRLVKEFPYLKNHQKKTLDANYYLFFFNRKYFQYFADQESIPPAIKRFIVREILESEKGAEHLTSQLVYIKQIINSISLSGLLFTESFDLQEDVRKKEAELLKKAKRKGLVLNNVYEVISLGNQIDEFIKIFYEVYYGKELRRKQGKNYEFIKCTTEKIIQNAKELIGIFDSLKASE